MRVVLLKPPVKFPHGGLVPSVSVPLGLISVAAALRQDGCDVELHDAQIDSARPLHPLDDGVHLGQDWATIERRLRGSGAAVVGIGCQAFAHRGYSLRAAAAARRACPDALIIGGGPVATVSPQDLLLPGGPFDAAVLGEGEETTRELLRCLRHGEDWQRVDGLAWRDERGVQRSAPRALVAELDTLPFPAFDLLDLEAYFRLTRAGLIAWWLPLYPGSERTVPILTSRGCPYSCTFCFVPKITGRRWRAHSPAYVERLIRWLQDAFDVRHVHLHDDCISIDRARFRELLRRIGGLERPVTWDLPSGTRLDDLDAELIRACRDAGCVYTVLPCESGSPRILNRVIKKQLAPSAALQAARACQDAGLDAKAFFVVGFPGETFAELWATLALATRLLLAHDVEAILQFASPWPQTELEAMCQERGLLPAVIDDDAMSRLPLGNARGFSRLHPWWKRLLCALHKQLQRGVLVGQGIAFYAPRPALALRLARSLLAQRDELPLLETLRAFVMFKRFFDRRDAR